MDRFHRLLVYLPLDHPVDVVVRTADELARQNDASVTLMDVFDTGGLINRGPRVVKAKVESAIAEAARARLAEAADLFTHVQPDVVVRTGVDFVEVINQVYEGEHDLLLVGSHPRSKESARLDPTLAHLLRKGPVPVWVVDESHREGDVLVAIGPEFEPESRTLNRTLVELGSSLAKRLGSQLHLTHSWRVVGESLLLGSRVPISQDDVDALLGDTRAAATKMVDELKSEVPLAHDAEVHLLHGKPEQTLVDLTKKLQPGVVVMGTLARKGIAGLIVGNTAEKVLSTIDASLMAVKPPWFVSPVPAPSDHVSMAVD